MLLLHGDLTLVPALTDLRDAPSEQIQADDLRRIEGKRLGEGPFGRPFIKGQAGDTVSLLSITGDVTGITTEGLEYPLQRGALKLGPTLGVSNVLTAPVARVQVEHGLLLCVHISNRKENEEWRIKGGKK